MAHAARAKDAAGAAAPNAGGSVSRPRGLCVRAAELSAVREDGREVDFVCSTDTEDSYGEIVRQTWRLGRFLKNPVALWAHDSHSLPIGQWLHVRVEDGALRGTLKVAPGKCNPQAEYVWQSILEKTLRAVSVGFMPGKVTYEDDETGDNQLCVLDDNELYEISVVPIPANPDAIVELKSKAFAGYVERRVIEGKGAVPYEAHPPKDTGKWDASAAVKRLRKWASADGSGSSDHIAWTKYRQAFAWMDPQRTHEFGGFKLPHHDVLDGALVTPKSGVIAAGDALMGDRGGVKIPPGDVASVKAHLAKHYHQFDLKAPWEDQDDKAASGTSGAAPTPTTSSPARAPKKEARVAKDMDEEAAKKAAKGMITCPNCGEDFDPDDEGDEDDDKSKAAHKLAHKVFEAHVKTRTSKLASERDAATSKAADLETKRATLEIEKKALEDKSAALQKQLIEAELTPLVGLKFAPAQLQGHVDLAAFYATQADGPAKWKTHLDGIKAAPDLKILGGSPIPHDPTPSGLTTNAADNSSELAAAVNAEANRTR